MNTPTRKPQVSILGSAEPGSRAYELAGEAGEVLAKLGITVVSGCGSPATRVAAERAIRAGGSVLSIVPPDVMPPDDWPATVVVPCGMGDARNLLMALSGDACIVIGGRAGTKSEVHLAWLHYRPLLPLVGCGGWSDSLPSDPPDERANSPILAWRDVDDLRSQLEVLGLARRVTRLAIGDAGQAADSADPGCQTPEREKPRMTPSRYALMAQYNRWMNVSLFDSAAKLPEAQLFQDRGAFFGSLFNTMSHIAVADLIWLHRFSQHEDLGTLRELMVGLPIPTSLTQRVADSLPDLRELRTQLDDIIIQLASLLSDSQLSATIRYSNTAGQTQAKNLGLLLQHFFNHQTHHRGQATTLLFQAGVDIGVTDFNALIPNETNNAATMNI